MINLKEINIVIKNTVQKQLDMLNAQLLFNIKHDTKISKFLGNEYISKTNIVGDLCPIKLPLTSMTIMPDLSTITIPEILYSMVIDKKLLDEAVDFQAFICPILNRWVLETIKDIGFLPNQAIGDTYLTLELPGRKGSFYVLQEDQNIQFRLYSSCLKII